jgi:hypothetical protein
MGSGFFIPEQRLSPLKSKGLRRRPARGKCLSHRTLGNYADKLPPLYPVACKLGDRKVITRLEP